MPSSLVGVEQFLPNPETAAQANSKSKNRCSPCGSINWRYLAVYRVKHACYAYEYVINMFGEWPLLVGGR